MSPQKEELDVDEDDENWPPWVTAKPEENDIVMVDEQQPQVSNSNSQTISRPSFNGASGLRTSSRPYSIGATHLKMLLIAFVVRYFFFVDVL